MLSWCSWTSSTPAFYSVDQQTRNQHLNHFLTLVTSNAGFFRRDDRIIIEVKTQLGNEEISVEDLKTAEKASSSNSHTKTKLNLLKKEHPVTSPAKEMQHYQHMGCFAWMFCSLGCWLLISRMGSGSSGDQLHQLSSAWDQHYTSSNHHKPAWTNMLDYSARKTSSIYTFDLLNLHY